MMKKILLTLAALPLLSFATFDNNKEPLEIEKPLNVESNIAVPKNTSSLPNTTYFFGLNAEGVIPFCKSFSELNTDNVELQENVLSGCLGSMNALEKYGKEDYILNVPIHMTPIFCENMDKLTQITIRKNSNFEKYYEIELIKNCIIELNKLPVGLHYNAN